MVSIEDELTMSVCVSVVGGQKLLKPGGLGGLNNGVSGLSGTADFGMDTSCSGGQTSMDIGALGDIGDPSASIGDDLMSTLQVGEIHLCRAKVCGENDGLL